MRIALFGLLLSAPLMAENNAAFDKAMNRLSSLTPAEKNYFSSQSDYALEDRALVGFNFSYNWSKVSKLEFEYSVDGDVTVTGTTSLSISQDNQSTGAAMLSYGYRALDWGYFFNGSMQLSDVDYSSKTKTADKINARTGTASQIKDMQANFKRKNSFAGGIDIIRFFPQTSVLVPYAGVGLEVGYSEFEFAFNQAGAANESGQILNTIKTDKAFSLVPRFVAGMQIQMADALLVNIGAHAKTSSFYKEGMGSYDVAVPVNGTASAQSYNIKPKADYTSYGVFLGVSYQL